MTTTRPRYREGQLLRSADLEAEQAYRLAMRRRHDIGPHRWGIVDGLELRAVPYEFVVEPGLAVDGYGRSAVVPAPWRIGWHDDLGLGGPAGDLFDQLGVSPGGRRRIGVWLRYGPVPASTCASAGPPDRRREGAMLELLPQTTAPTPRSPPGVPTAALDFGPQDAPPDDPELAWPVYLGELIRTEANGGYTYRASRRRRPHAGLVGEQVADPTGTVRMQVGSERPDDSRRLAVGVGGPPAEVERLAVTADGDTTLTGSVTLQARRVTGPERGDLLLRRGRPERTGLRLGSRPAPETAAPWQLYHATVQSEEDADAGRAPDHQLRFEIEDPSGRADPASSRFVIACGAPPGPGLPGPAGLTVRADCTVVAQSVTVEGELIRGADQTDLRDELLAGTLTLAGPQATGPAAEAARAASAIDAQLTPPAAPINPGTQVRFTVRNSGTVALTDIAVIAAVAVLDSSGGGTPANATVAQGIRLDPGASSSGVAATLPNAPNKDVYVAVTAIGIGPVANPVSDTAETRVRVVP